MIEPLMRKLLKLENAANRSQFALRQLWDTLSMGQKEIYHLAFSEAWKQLDDTEEIELIPSEYLSSRVMETKIKIRLVANT